MNKYFLLFAAMLLFTSCATVVSKYVTNDKYLIYKSSSLPESVFEIKTDKSGKKWGELSSPLLFKSAFIGGVDFDNTGDITFNIESINFFANWYNGWTEGKADAYGKLLFKKDNDTVKCSVADKIEIWDVTEGKVKYFDENFINDEGLRIVKNRIERIKVLVDFLKKQNMPEYFGHTRLKTEYGDSMKDILLPFLFPEKSDDKPQGYYDILKTKDNSDDKSKFSDNWYLGFDILWNKKYSKKIFPEILQDVRNSGTMWRDYEEAPGLIMMLYNLDYYVNKKLPDETFSKAK